MTERCVWKSLHVRHFRSQLSSILEKDLHRILSLAFLLIRLVKMTHISTVAAASHRT
jgi:hypothetical protein